MTDAKFQIVWSRLRELWPPFPNQNDKVIRQVYWRRLRRYRDSAVEAAIGRCLDECKRFPSVAQIVERLPDNPYEAAVTTSFDQMNEQIRQKIAADGCIYKVTWLATAAGTITGYRLERPTQEGHKGEDRGRDRSAQGTE